MNDNDQKLTFRESAGLLGYGFKTAAELVPMYYPCILLCSLVTAAQPLIILFFSSRILNELNGARGVRTILMYTILTVGLTFALSIFKALMTREINTHASYEQVSHRIQMAQAEQFASMDFTHTEDSKASEILAQMNIFTRATGRGLMMMYRYVVGITDNLFSLILAVALLVNVSGSFASADTGIWTVALYAVFAVGLIMTLFNSKREEAKLQKIIMGVGKHNAVSDYYNKYITADQAAMDVRLYRQNSIIREATAKTLDTRPWMPFFFFTGRVNGFSMALFALMGGGVYLISGYNALGGAVPVGSIVQSVGSMTAIATAIGSLVWSIGRIWNNAPFLKPLQEYFTLPDVLIKGNRPVPAPEKEDYTIEFRNVSFKYPGAEGYALHGLNLNLTHGERLAIVGLNGSGKTTMVKLLCRLYDPTDGDILLNGVSIKEYDFDQYTALLSVVFQDYKLFPLPLSQNVAVSEQFNASLVNKALDGAGFAERIKTMPAGLDTVLYKDYDESGVTVSGGEAQKIALARALYKDAPIVVLDEPTAALDPIAEYEVYTTFDQTIGNKTAVFISHRLSSCRFCHRIAVFDAGRLVQLGSHNELLDDKNGRYHELWEAQASHYRD